MKQKRAFALVLLVGEVIVVEPPGGIDAAAFVLFSCCSQATRSRPLSFQWMMQQIHVVLRELAVGQSKGTYFWVAGSIPMLRANCG